MIKELLETALNYEVDRVIGTEKYSRSSLKEGYRNGFRIRKKKVLTTLGAIENVKRPRVKGTVYKSKILTAYQRRFINFDKAILQYYLKGTSCRRLRDIFERIFNTYFSHNQISEILKKLQEKLDLWRKQKINETYDALIIDGIWINVRTLPKIIAKTMKKRIALVKERKSHQNKKIHKELKIYLNSHLETITLQFFRE